MVLALVTLPLLLRGLGPVTFGTWALVQTFSAVTGWVSLVDLGLGTAATGRSPRGRRWTTSAVSPQASAAPWPASALGMACRRARCPGPVCCCPGCSTRRPFCVLRSSSHGPVRRPGLADLLTEGVEACLEGLQRVDLSRAVDAFRRTAVAAATAVVALAGGGLRGVAVASLVASGAGLLVASRCCASPPAGSLARPSVARVRALVHYGKTVALLQPLGVIHRTMDRLIVGVVLGPGAVTFVEIATQVQNGADAVLSASSYSVVRLRPGCGPGATRGRSRSCWRPARATPCSSPSRSSSSPPSWPAP